MRSVILIGGSKKFGSGKVMRYAKNHLASLGSLEGFVETQQARFGILQEIWAISKNQFVLFQPSVCFPAFVRDVLIVALLRLKGFQISFLLLVDVKYKNPLMKLSFFRRLFFGNSQVFGLAEFSVHVGNSQRLPAFFDSKGLEEVKVQNPSGEIAQIHLGYFNHMKGWMDFQSFIGSSSLKLRAFGIGGDGSVHEETVSTNIELFPGLTTLEIQSSLGKIAQDFVPVYVFLSREDFAPLMVLEAGLWGLPIVTVRGTRAHGILNRFLPRGAFLVVECLSEVEQHRADLEKIREEMGEFLETVGAEEFCRELVNHLATAQQKFGGKL